MTPPQRILVFKYPSRDRVKIGFWIIIARGGGKMGLKGLRVQIRKCCPPPCIVTIRKLLVFNDEVPNMYKQIHLKSEGKFSKANITE